jgi:hypothetical protein
MKKRSQERAQSLDEESDDDGVCKPVCANYSRDDAYHMARSNSTNKFNNHQGQIQRLSSFSRIEQDRFKETRY